MENIHLALLALTGALIATADHDAFMYVFGKNLLLEKQRTKLLHYGVWIGLTLMIITGALLAFPLREYYVTDSAFIIKMCMVGALVGNGVLIGKLSSLATHVPFKGLSFHTKLFLLASGAISTSGWVGAAVIGFFFL